MTKHLPLLAEIRYRVEENYILLIVASDIHSTSNRQFPYGVAVKYS